MAELVANQTPTRCVVLPYDVTKGPEAINLYNFSKKTAMLWQELLASDMMAINEEGLWVHTKYGYSVPRRNGKSELLDIRELDGLLNGERILHTAHRTTTTHSSWERLCTLLEEVGLQEGRDFITWKQMGLEKVEMLDTQGKVAFRTRTSKGGLGEGYDTLIIDEAQEYTDDQQTALKYVVSDSKNPQIIFCGTPPTVVSAGTVFQKLRKNALQGESENTGWAEWSVDNMTAVTDKEAWYRTNPSLGEVLTERAIKDEIDDEDIDFNIQRLGLWLQYNQKSAISKAEWQACRFSKLPVLCKDIFAAVKYGPDGENVSLAVACKDEESKKPFVEVIDCQSTRNGNAWIVNYLKAMKPREIWIDGANGQQGLAQDLKENRIKHSKLPTVKEIIAANSAFEKAVFQEELLHGEQPSMEQAISNCEHRSIGNNGGFGFRALREGIEISLIESAALAYWACSNAKERKVQSISY